VERMERAGVRECDESEKSTKSESGTCGHVRALECDGRAEGNKCFIEVHVTPLNAKGGPTCESEKGVQYIKARKMKT
jgi:hypothetical protein